MGGCLRIPHCICPSKTPTVVSFDEIHPQLKTGDLVLFRPAFSKLSCAIIVCSCTRHSHVGMIIRTSPNPADIRVAHATAPHVNEFYLDEVVKSGDLYEDIVVRPLKHSLGDLNENKLIKFHIDQLGTEFRLEPLLDGLLCLQCCGCAPCRSAEEVDDVLFCSQYIAKGYQLVGLLPKHKIAASFSPGSFTTLLPAQFDPPLRIAQSLSAEELARI